MGPVMEHGSGTEPSGTRLGRRRLLGLAAGAFAAPGLVRAGAGAQEASPEAGETPRPSPEASAAAEGSATPGSREPFFTGTPAPRRGAVTIYSGRSENLVGPLFTGLDAASGIDIEVRYAGTPELAATLLEEGDDTPADVFFAQDAGALGLLANEGRFQELPDELLARVEPRFRSPDGLWVGVSGRARVLVYNTDELQEADLPTSVLELTDPRWRGQVGWAPENASFQAFVTALRVLEGEDGARGWLEGMLENEPVNFGDSNVAIDRAVGNGEVQVGLTNHYYLYAVKEEEGADFPIANHYFATGDPGSLVNVAGVGVLAAAGNTEQALRIVDDLLGEEAQTYFAEETDEYPMIAGIPTAPGLKPLAEIGSPEIDLSELAGLRETVQLLVDVGVL